MARARHFKEKERKSHKLLIIILIVLIIISVVYIIRYFINQYETNKESDVLASVEIDESQITDDTTERMLQVRELQKENSDIVGWLEIEGTNMNYPVLQGDDNSYYMTHNYKRETTSSGSLFLDKDYDWDIPSSNLLIYGHNNLDGLMFQELLKYEDEDFFKEHPTFRFTTADEDAEYEIISAFKSRVYYKSEKNVFRYYYFVNANTEEEYNQFITNAKKASLYNIDASAKYGDQLITLSTCSYHVKDGRFVIVGRKIE